MRFLSNLFGGGQRNTGTDAYGRDYDDPDFNKEGGYVGRGGSTSKGGGFGGLLGGQGGGDMWGAIGSSLISGIFASRAASQQANAQMRMTEAQDRRFNNMILENRGIGKLKIANGLWQDWANNRMQDNNLERQKDAALFEAKTLSPWQNAAEVDRAERLTNFALGEDATEQRRRQNVAQLGANLLNKRASMAGLFGETYMDQRDFQRART